MVISNRRCDIHMQPYCRVPRKLLQIIVGLSADIKPPHFPTLSYAFTPPSTALPLYLHTRYSNPSKKEPEFDNSMGTSICKIAHKMLLIIVHVVVVYRDKYLPVSSVLELLVLNNLNPIVIRIKHKCYILHASISQTLLPVNTLVLESLACGVEIVNRNTYHC